MARPIIGQCCKPGCNTNPYLLLLFAVVRYGEAEPIALETTEQCPPVDIFVAAWLPGTEGDGVSDMLFGDHEFTGKLPYTWQRWNKQLQFDFKSLPTGGCEVPLFSYGFGLKTTDALPQIPDCPKP